MADEKSEMEKAVERIEKSNAGFKDEVITKTAAEDAKIQKEVEAHVKDLNAKIEAKQAEIEKQGATILQVQETVKTLSEKSGRKIISLGGNGSKANLIDTLGGWIEKNADKFIHMADTKKELGGMVIDTKASTITTASITGQAYGTYLDWRPGMEPSSKLVHFRDLAPILPSNTDTVYYPRANAVNAGGSFGVQVNEYDTKAQIDRAFTMITLTLKAFAGWARVSRQALRNIPFLQAYLPSSMQEQLLVAEDTVFANALFGTAGVQTSAVYPAGAEVLYPVQQLTYLVTNLLKQNFWPNAIAIAPDAWANILNTRPNDFGTPAAYTINPVTGVMSIMGIPIYPVNWLAGNRVIVADWNRLAVVESEGLTLRQSDNVGTDFIQNAVVFLLERVEGLAVFRPDAVIDTTLVLK